MPKLCLKCNKEFKNHVVINGKEHNLQRRKYCLECSPFSKHNTKQIHCEIVTKSYSDFTEEEKKEFNRKIYNKQRERRWERKAELVNLKGGKCCKCGYDKNIAALSFHHRNPKDKSYELDSRSIGSKKMDDILLELNKCDLYCSNCHAELHHPHFNKMVVPNSGASVIKPL